MPAAAVCLCRCGRSAARLTPPVRRNSPRLDGGHYARAPGHPLLGRLHKPDPKLPDDAQDKRSVVPLEPDQWIARLSTSAGEAAQMLVPPTVERFDLADARLTDALLGAMRGGA